MVVAPLLPDATYRYQFRRGGTTSDVGTFRTAPLPSVARSVRFAFSGDSDGTKVGGVPFFNNFETLDAARDDGLDFFVYHGDTIYSETEVVDKRESKSRPQWGIVTFEHRARNQHGELVMRARRQAMMRKRSA